MSDIDVSKLSIMNGWLVYETGIHSCAGDTAESGYAHERGCGYEPVIRLEDLGRVLASHFASRGLPPVPPPDEPPPLDPWEHHDPWDLPASPLPGGEESND